MDTQQTFMWYYALLAVGTSISARNLAVSLVVALGLTVVYPQEDLAKYLVLAWLIGVFLAHFRD